MGTPVSEQLTRRGVLLLGIGHSLPMPFPPPRGAGREAAGPTSDAVWPTGSRSA